MNNRIPSVSSSARPASSNQALSHTSVSYIPPARKVLSPGEWVRAVSGFEAPFGFDRMPTVFG